MACNVTRGYFPQRGSGFQTVALSEELLEKPHLLRPVEEMAAYYEVSPPRRAAGDLPVRETYFHVFRACFGPDDWSAVGRTVDWGAGPSGRSGNYLARHLIFRWDAVDDPFALLETPWLHETEADLEPRLLPPLELPSRQETVEPDVLPGYPEEAVAGLIHWAVSRDGKKTALLVGDERRSRRLLRELACLLPAGERSRLHFATHFYRACHPLRDRFSVVTVQSWAEAPSGRENYLVYDLEAGKYPRVEVKGLYPGWAARALKQGRGAEVCTLGRAAGRLRAEAALAGLDLPDDPGFYGALWELAGPKIAPALRGRAPVISQLVAEGEKRRELADALLDGASPLEVCGAVSAEEARRCLAALRSAAGGKAWRAWEKTWEGDPLLKSLPRAGWAFWQR
jgi:hypothetical protein